MHALYLWLAITLKYIIGIAANSKHILGSHVDKEIKHLAVYIAVHNLLVVCQSYVP
jgi:hypothetical protein